MWIAADEPCKLVGQRPIVLAILLQTGKFTTLPNMEMAVFTFSVLGGGGGGDNEQLRRD